MTKEQLPTPTEPDDGLNERQRRFAMEFFSGENAANATRSYLAVNPQVKESTAASAASDLLKDPNLQAFLSELNREAREGAIAEMRPWLVLAAEAQHVVLLTCRGVLRSRLCLDAAKEILDRCFGKPTERIEHQHRDERRITRALFQLAVRQQDD